MFKLKQSKLPKDLNGIRGWLILPAIGLILSIVFVPISLIYLFNSYIQISEITQSTLPGFTAIFWYATLALFSFGVWGLIVARSFFSHQAQAPRQYMRLWYISLLAGLVEVGLVYVWFNTEGANLGVNEAALSGSVANLAITFTVNTMSMLAHKYYFQRSKRVKATFTQ